MWFKHRAWIPVAWVLCIVNVVSTWFAAAPVPSEPFHATGHALLAVLFGLGAQRLAARRRGLMGTRGVAELPADIGTLRAELEAVRQAQAGTLDRVEHAVDAIAIEMERIGEGQRFLTRVLAERAREPDK